MKLVIEYNRLMKDLTYVSSVSNSHLSLDVNKAVVVKATKELLNFYGESGTIGVVTDVESTDFKLDFEGSDQEELIFQVKTKELMSFLKTFTVDRTYPTDVVFDINNNRLNLTVHEEPLEGEPSYLKNSSTWVFDLAKLKKSTLEAMDIRDGESVVHTELLSLYVDSMLPLLDNADASMNDSRLNFEDSYVYVFTSRVVALFKNKLPESMKGIVLGYASVQLLKELSSDFEQILVTKDDESSKLFITAGNNRIALKFNRKMPPYQRMMEDFQTENSITLDRKMLSTAIRRLNLVKENTILEIDTDTEILNVSNKSYSQGIPLSSLVGNDLKGFKAGVVTRVLEDAIIGNDEMYPEELTVRVSKTNNAYLIVLTDELNTWFSAFRVASRN